MSAAERRIAQLERANAEDEVRIQAHAVTADLHLTAAQGLRLNQRSRNAIIDLLRAEGLPAMQPIQRMLPRPQHAAADRDASEETARADRLAS